MRRRRNRVSAKAIALGAIAVFAAIVYAAFATHLPFTQHYEIRAVVVSTGQLRPDAPVRIAGVSVGRVARIDPGPGATQVVTLEIEDSGRPVGADATLKIRPRLFLEGGSYVQLAPGSPSARELEHGATIPLGQTSRAVALDEVLSSLDRDTRESFRATVRELDTALAGGGADALARLPRPLAPALRDLAVVSQAARGKAPHDLSDVVASSARIASALASRDAQLADLVTNLNTTTGALAAHDTALGASVRELDGLLREAPAQLALVDRALPSLERLTIALRLSLRIAPPVLRGGADLMVQVEALSRPAELPRLLDLLGPSLHELPRLTRRLTSLFPNVTPVTDCVRDRALPVLEAELDDGALSTGRPVWQDLVHGLAGAASTSQGFDGNSPWLRLIGAVGERTFSLGQTLPTGDQLFARMPEPILGVRPQPLPAGELPPLRPDAECRDQPPPDLRARNGPPPAQRVTSERAPRPSPAQLRRLRGLLDGPRR